MQNYNHIYKALKKFRINNGISLQTVEKNTRISMATLYKIEKGGNVTIEYFVEYVNAIGLNINFTINDK